MELTDNGYESDANHQALQEKGVDLIAPPTGKPPEGFRVMDFELSRHAFQEDQERINLFKQRAGGEAGFSQLKVNLGLRRLRCRGSVKSKFKIIMAVTSLNIKRAFNWMEGGSSGSRSRKKKDFKADTGILLFFYSYSVHIFVKL
ncbi:hypothetical protein Dthio_PD2726 [Desulfonatronospira thiodismutans ASO3-1]|uniref:Transposase DDE domain-containing protein n=1 Tax=Desulfonatronospira thiodismutans ASO3-1 TaxID=555779 RepID=D6SKV0_9BACT|nr:hypothetical protein Dthio_PD2726 [Desulfonatronospira thiodismutans ASO3-1]